MPHNKDKTLKAYYRGNDDARENRGNHAHEYKGDARRAYANGYREGQLERAALKKHKH